MFTANTYQKCKCYTWDFVDGTSISSIKTNLASIEKIQVFESSDRLTQSGNGQGSEIDLDVSQLQIDNYVFKIHTTEGFHVRSFVKMP